MSKWAAAFWVSVVLGWAPEASGYSLLVDSQRRCPEAHRDLCAALNTGNLEERRAAVLSALTAESPEARQTAAHFLRSLEFDIDLRPYVDIYMQYCGGVKPGCSWTRENEYWAALRFDPRERRLEAIERFLQTGRSGHPTGHLPRYMAVQLAASQGLGELEPMIREYLDTLTPAARTRFRLDMIPAQLELTRDGEDERDAAAAAGARLARLEDDELYRRMEEDQGFREAVLREADVACKVSILSGQRPEPCSVYSGLVHRQKARFPDSSFSSGSFIIGKPVPAWLNALHSAAGIAPPTVSPEEIPLPRVRTPRKARLDPCSVPDVPGLERSQTEPFWGGTYFVLLRESSGAEVGIADGIVGHRPGETVRLRLDIRDQRGVPPNFPVAVRVSMLDGSDGALRPTSGRQTCRSLNLFWNRAAARETSLVAMQEFDVTLGHAELAGMLPDPRAAGQTIPLWKSTARLRIDVVRVEEAERDWSRQGGAIYDVRPLGDIAASELPNPFAILARKRNAEGGEFESFGPDLQTPYDAIVRQPLRQYWAIVDESEKADSILFGCYAQREDDSERGPTEDVTLRRLGRSSIFVGPMTLAPGGTLLPGWQPSPTLPRPLVLLGGGLSSVVCEPKEEAP
jgi:hypothetical protein